MSYLVLGHIAGAASLKRRVPEKSHYGTARARFGGSVEARGARAHMRACHFQLRIGRESARLHHR